ncbi:hypothetical protein NVP1152O_064 [Vibrio phage 1.152.O._10N.222.46.E1]|uniref:Membrane lipoprotein n=4 Tax=Nahantvirus 49C7 TaxID=2846601 RepID=A0A2I7RBD5_9CAUD|nr:hypothetical protein NVP1025O_063 [Vibrio phage 1.025.O._10N.222.46.B6]AUR90796.1 hypothetical protein NVP1150O_063 [Vibrio phage 1.150.O._10N.222.46.A6]AUR90969.1 hypothetical protein NVP1152O_064 [Vibrio phage 1.152.O._10N.222.46.E1]AUS02437.1 hypothetical protein NVP2130O_063 [Vibrio phage 2.130.O._10N.222.46.C2]
MKMLITMLAAACVVGCGPMPTYKIVPVVHAKQHDAATAWYNYHMEEINALTMEQEAMGWVYRCENGYYFSSMEIGGLSNYMNPKVSTDMKGCSEVAYMHTHPRQHVGWTADFFSPEDMESSQLWGMYMMAQENCNLRYTYLSDDRDGELLGNFTACKK